LLVAFAMLPPLDAVLGYVVFPLLWWLGVGTPGLADPMVAARAFVPVAGFIGLIVTVAGAMPVVFTQIRRGPISLRQALLAGLALGNAPLVVIVYATILLALGHMAMGTISEHLAPVSALVASPLRAIAIGSAYGVMSALVFWVAGVWRSDLAG
jgi:hypothetical protein